MKMKTVMQVEQCHMEPDGIGGSVPVWQPIDVAVGVFCADLYGYRFIYRCSRNVSDKDRFRMGSRQFSVTCVLPSAKPNWSTAMLQECVT